MKNHIDRKFYFGGAKTKPRFSHDCYKCLYLGSTKKFDVYYCKMSNLSGGSIILRRDSLISAYWSSPISIVICSEIQGSEEIDTAKTAVRNLIADGLVRITAA